jgi:hypothetical protein
VLAGVHLPVLALWRRAGVVEAIGEASVFPRVQDAVRAVGGGPPSGDGAALIAGV